MGSNYPNTSIGETCYVTDGAHAKVERQNKGVLYLTSKNFSVGSLILDKVDYISQADFERLFKDTGKSQRRLKDGDVLTGIIGTFGNAYRYTENDNFGISSSVAILRPNYDVLNSDFLYYVITSPSFKATVEAYKGGSVQGYTNIATLKSLPIPLPSLEVQEKVVGLLKSLDKRIEINRKMNETLEQMAQALFKSWFVDFDPVIDNVLDAGNPIPEELETRAEQRRQLRDAASKEEAPAPSLPDEIRSLFPSEFELTDDMGWIPKGWKVSTTHDEFEIKGGSTPSTKNPDFWEGGDINWTSPKDLSGKADKVLLDTERKITRQGLGKITSGLLPVDTVLMSSRAPVGYLALAKVPVAINQGYIALICNKTITPEYSIQWLSSVMDEIKSISGGTTFSEISKKTFRSIKLVVPVEGVVTEYTKYAAEYYQRIAQAVKESDSLSTLRDYLLPKLISGELQIPDAEQQIAEVMS